MENISKNGRYKGQQGKVVKETEKALKLLMFSDRIERWFQMKYLCEVVPDEDVPCKQRVPGKKAKREEQHERVCEVDDLVMSFHKGLPSKLRVTEKELAALFLDLMKLFE